MTRINLIPPQFLADQHLVAEHKEILQLCGSYKLSKKSKRGLDLGNLPNSFRLGTGHVRFFYNKLAYLHKRFLLVQEEMRFREIKVNVTMRFNSYIKDGTYRDWKPSKADLILITKRINSKVKEKPKWYRYKGKSYVTTRAYKNLLAYEKL